MDNEKGYYTSNGGLFQELHRTYLEYFSFREFQWTNNSKTN